MGNGILGISSADSTRRTSHLSTLTSQVLRLLVGTRFQVLFHSPPGVLFTFPSRYWSTIGYQGVFSLGSGASRFPTGFLVSRRTQDPHRDGKGVSATGFLPSVTGRPRPLRLRLLAPIRVSCYPGINDAGLGSLRFARRYSGDRVLLSLPPGTKMFQFPGYAFQHLCLQ